MPSNERRRFRVHLQNEIEKKKQEEERMEKRMTELESENRRMREPLEAAKKEMEELKRRAENYEKDKALLTVRPVLLSLSLSSSKIFLSEHQTSLENV